MSDFDVILVGGGLANGLIALRLLQDRPHLRLLLIERAAQIGGRHTWSFHGSDLTPAQQEWIMPLAVARWEATTVRFPGFKRRLVGTYASLTSENLIAALSARPGLTQLCGCLAETVAPDRVALPDGRSFTAPLVIDGRGYRPDPALDLRWQKFLGLELDCPNHGLSEPVIMDATVPQDDGYRFIYLLPFTADRLLVEDTYYSDGPVLDLPQLEARIMAYATVQGWTVRGIVQRETGVLPLALAGDIDTYLAAWTVPCSGLAAALFQPVTGYSLPNAVRLAEAIAAAPVLESQAILALVRQTVRAHWRATRFLRLLNRMMFLAAQPDQRWRILARFYRLPAALIARFYAARLNWLDQVRLLAGKPPVALLPALRACLSTRKIRT